MQVNIPEVGLVNFPDTMTPDQVHQTISTQIWPQVQASKMKFSSANVPGPTQPNFNNARAAGGVSAGPEQPWGTGREFGLNMLQDFQAVAQKTPTDVPQTVGQGLHNSAIHALQGLTTPTGAALGAAAMVPGLDIPLAGLLAGMGAKGMGEVAGNIAGAQNPSIGQKVEAGGDIAQNALMMLPGVAHTALPEMAGAAAKLPGDFIQDMRGQQRPTLNFGFGKATPNLPSSKPVGVPPTPPSEPIKTVPPLTASTALPVQPKSDWEQYQTVQKKMMSSEFGSPEFQNAWKENEIIKNRNGGMPPQDPNANKASVSGKAPTTAQPPVAEAKPVVSFKPAIKIGDQVVTVEGHRTADAQKLVAQNPGKPIVRGYLGSDGSFVNNPLEAARAVEAQQKAPNATAGTAEKVGQVGQRQGQEAAGQVQRQGQTQGLPVQRQVQKAPQGEVPGAVGGTARSGSKPNVQSVRGKGGVDESTILRNLLEIPEAHRNEGQRERIADMQQRGVNPRSGKRDSEGGFFRLFGGPDLSRLGMKPEARVQGEQMYNRIKNVLGATSGAFSWMDKAGLKDFLQVPRTIKELGEWLDSTGPKTEVHSYGMEGKVSEARKEYDKMTHEWWETLPIETRQKARRGMAMDLNQEDAAK